MSIRSASYNREEDILLCEIYMEISQDPCVGVHQKSEKFWNRVATKFHSEKHENRETRTERSLQSRVQTIERAIRKLHACIRTIEGRHQSGASNEDIMWQAKVLVMEDPKYKSGWKFDHVWGIMKDFEKFKDCRKSSARPSFGHVSSESDNPNFEGQSSPGITCSPLNLNDDFNCSDRSPSERPIGIKKAKLKRKKDEFNSSIFKTLQEGREQLLERLEKSNAQLQQHLDESRAYRDRKREEKLLLKDLSSITDPQVRAYFEAEKTRILQKGAQEYPPESFTSGTFGGYFNNIGGSGSGLPDY